MSFSDSRVETHFFQQDQSKICKYFSGLAYKDIRLGQEHTVHVKLAKNCLNAIRLKKIAPQQSQAYIASDIYLYRLTKFKTELVDISIQRFDKSRSSNASTKLVSRPISKTGFYLMADVTGVLEHGTRFETIYQQTMYPTTRKADVIVVND